MLKIREENYLDFGLKICDIQRLFYKNKMKYKREREEELLIGRGESKVLPIPPKMKNLTI